MKTLSFGIIYLLLVAIFIGCTQKSIISGPKEFYIKPDLAPEISVINILASFPTANVEQILNTKVPEIIYQDTIIEDDNYTLKVTKSAAFKVEPAGDLLLLTAPLKIEAKARLKAGFFSAEKNGTFDIEVKFNIKPGLTPEWKITTSSTSAGYRWITEPKVKLGPLEVSVAPFLDKIINVQQELIAREIDKRVNNYFEIKPYAEEAWKYLQNPIPINKSINAWTKIEPLAIYFIPISGTKENIRFGLGIKAKLETLIGVKPEYENIALPSLSFGSNADSLFSINLISKIGFKEASAIAKERLSNSPIVLESGKYKININELEFYGSGENLVVKSVLSGDYNGLIYLYGIPYFDESTATIKVKDLNFAAETENKLKQTYSWLFKGVLRKQLAANLQFPLNNKVNNASETLTNYLNNLKIADGIKVNAKVNSLIPDKILIGNGELIVSIQAKGRVEMQIEIKEFK